MPEHVIISPAGFIAQYNYPTYPFRGVGQAPLSVTPVLASGSTLAARGVGDYNLTHVTTAAGSIQAQFITPSAGNVAVAFLVDNTTTPKAYLGIALDSHMRPYAVMTDVNGAVVARTTNSGAFGVVGSLVHILLSWSASMSVRGNINAYLKVNNTLSPEGDWTTTPTAPWTPFVPVAMLLGVGNIGSLGDFTPASGIVSVQLSPVPSPVVNVSMVTSHSSNSSMTSNATVASKATAPITGRATMTANMTKVP